MRQKLLAVADAYSFAAGIGRKRVSTIVLNGGAKLDAIAGGADLTTGTYEKAMAWFAANWPDGAVWPGDVSHPEPLIEAAE
ncbi:MAG: hypothetical protein ACK4U0_17330 [Mesorhizobium sp.]